MDCGKVEGVVQLSQIHTLKEDKNNGVYRSRCKAVAQ
jgi:hypothetical protein